MSDECGGTPIPKQKGKGVYVMGIAAATLLVSLSYLEPRIHGLTLWLIFLLSGFAALISVLKLRSLIRGRGWVFPRTDAALLTTVVVGVWLHLWFS